LSLKNGKERKLLIIYSSIGDTILFTCGMAWLGLVRINLPVIWIDASELVVVFRKYDYQIHTHTTTTI